MIYGRFGGTVTILRTAVLADVQRLDERKPDKKDKEALKLGAYIVVRSDDKERLYHQAYLRADGGSVEIGKAIEEADKTYRLRRICSWCTKVVDEGTVPNDPISHTICPECDAKVRAASGIPPAIIAIILLCLDLVLR